MFDLQKSDRSRSRLSAALLLGMSLGATAGELPRIEPTYHRLPLAVPEPVKTAIPVGIDAGSALEAWPSEPTRIETPAIYRGLSTLRLTDDVVESWQKQAQLQPSGASQPIESIAYNPSQLRAAYELGDQGHGGSGQTIVIVDAYHHPNVVADLNAFSARFGLPHCTLVDARSIDALPPVGDDCTISRFYTDAAGKATTKPPRFNAGWAQETALDTQWAHAFAPRARIVLIEAANPEFKAMLGAIALGNKIGGSPLSMSFGTSETEELSAPEYTSAAFGTASMSYAASAGDFGTEVSWPAVVPSVLSVGGTTLDYKDSRIAETVWSGSGGGISQWTPRPSYQQQLPLAADAAEHRVNNDVALDADPKTGVYVAFSTRVAKTPKWYVFGGTSLSAPVWAGVLALANAERASRHLPPLGAAHARLYAQLTRDHAAHFFNITAGSNGDCSVCRAGPGYNSPTGLGTPRIGQLLQTLVSDQG